MAQPGLILAVEEFFPSWGSTIQFWHLSLAQWLGLLVFAVGSLLAGTFLQWLLVTLGRSLARHPGWEWVEKFMAILAGPARFVLALVLFQPFVQLLDLAPAPQDRVETATRVVLIVTFTWLCLRLLAVGSLVFQGYLTHRIVDVNRIRSIQTQMAVPRVILRVAIVLVGTALVLLQFEVVRSVGVSLLASAGLAGLIVGLAAQRTIGNLLAGIQLAVSQPIRIGDAIVIENEWGWVEEISLTYVVVKIWDLRRLIVPVSYFLDKPFQNWTRGPTHLQGTVFLYTDYSVSIEGIRGELQNILNQTPLWDHQVQGVQVTNLTDKTVEVRVLLSARDGPQMWDLRCLVRERLLSWLQSRRPAPSSGQASVTSTSVLQ
jgi:small-conductance mechanosensitive channel